MWTWIKRNWQTTPSPIPLFVVLVLLAVAMSLNPSTFLNLAWFALVALTALYAYATLMVVQESKRMRLDAVKPSLSLQPGMFTMDERFHALYLVNSGGVAKGVKIDINVNNPPSKKALFMTALNKGYLAYLPINNISKLYNTGGLVEISVTYKDSYDQDLNANLSFDFANLKEEGRDVIGQESELHEIKRVLEQIERKIGQGR